MSFLKGFNKNLRDVNKTAQQTGMAARNVNQTKNSVGNLVPNSVSNMATNRKGKNDKRTNEKEVVCENTWACACGSTSTTKFCSECGKQKPVCSNCGVAVKTKFCSECGTAVE
ncbi:MAG: hypothetical protein FWB72_05825 [Firmicutes bacterium]|nr:hypothetical protein [Bacillota bacterium]